MRRSSGISLSVRALGQRRLQHQPGQRQLLLGGGAGADERAVERLARQLAVTSKTLSGENGLATCGARLVRSIG